MKTRLNRYFSPYIKQMAGKLGQSEKYVSGMLRQWYNGYSWDGEHFVYNPFSVVNLFKTGSFGNYWFSTGTPGFLIETIKNKQAKILEFENLPAQDYIFDSCDIEHMEIAPLLFQTGYLTIKSITVSSRDLRKTYYLSYPNLEVRHSFLTHLFGMLTQKTIGPGTRTLQRIGKTVNADDIEGFVKEVKTLFASIPHQIIIGEKEAYYHTVIYLLLSLSGAAVRCEESTNTGRIDAVLKTDKKITVMEFKLDETASR